MAPGYHAVVELDEQRNLPRIIDIAPPTLGADRVVSILKGITGTVKPIPVSTCDGFDDPAILTRRNT